VETTHPVTAIAREPSSVLKISRDLFRQVLERHPSTAEQLRQVFKSRFGELRQQLRLDPYS
jgi:CRP-like cAMP-binding protein